MLKYGCKGTTKKWNMQIWRCEKVKKTDKKERGEE